ncbi:MAG: type II toxin-antitoxin system VapC family toxin [Candidatus Coatesbacteria bacterium]
MLDASVAVKIYLEEVGSDLARQLPRRIVTGETVLLAPELVRVELAGALLRVRGPDWRSVQADMARFEVLGITLHPLTAELASSAVRIAGEHNLRVADAVYAALAERSGCAVVSADADFVRRLAGTGLAVSLSSLR